MSDNKPPNPFTDVRKGLGLLFRAARTTAQKLPTTHLGKELEDAVLTSAREVGRAFENVASTLQREVLGRVGVSRKAPAETPQEASPPPNEPHDPKPGDPG